MFTDAGLSGSEMAHQGAMGLALLVAAIVSVKFLEASYLPWQHQAPKKGSERGQREEIEV